MSEVKVNKISPRTNCGTVTVGDSGDSVSVSAGVPVTVNNNLTVSGDLKSAALKAGDGGNIINQCGTTITLGASGDTVSLASGASQTGFGRTGTVDWDTTKKTASFTATSGDGFFVDTTSSALTVTLPASPSAGDIVGVADYAGRAATNNNTIARNGSNIEGIASDATLNTNRDTVTLVYVDATQGWVAVNSNDAATIAPAYVTASGGNATITCGDFKTHIFTGPGTFTVSCAGNPLGSSTVDYFVVAGGGGGHRDGGAGAGGGGFRVSNSVGCVPAPTMSPLSNPTGLSVTATGFPITVGGGGAALTGGSNSVFSTITSAGGGASNTNDGGSGGGARANGPAVGGSGNTPPVSPPQGNDGGNNCHSAYSGAAGGGGAGAAGSNATKCTGGPGGSGSFVAVAFGSPPSYGTPGPVGQRYFAGGGGGSYDGAPGPAGSGGTGGGGNGQNGQGENGVGNTGGGAGGGRGGPFSSAASGGSGIVMIRYKFQ